MCLMPRSADGYYDDNGEWQRTKYCFVSCGSECTCGPPGGVWYSAAHDKRLERTAPSSPGSTAGSGPAVGVQTLPGIHVSVEAVDAATEGAGSALSEPE